MNTIKSFWVGWGALCVAGGGAYYFAKQSILADRHARYEADLKRRRVQEALEYSNPISNKPPRSSTIPSAGLAAKIDSGPPLSDHSGSPSAEATADPAPTRHAPDSEEQRVVEKSKYEASEPYRAKKGDRFS